MRVDGLGCTIDGRTLLEAVSFSLSGGEALAVLGPSGAGKSLVLRCLLGLAPAQATVTGTLFWDERRVPLADRPALARLRGRGLALVPQAAAASLDPMRTVGQQLREVCVLHGTDSRPRERLAEVGLSHEFVDRHPHALSGGQAQRVALALALACRPAVLLADEPMASLDCVSQAELVDLLVKRCAAEQVALVLVSHDLARVARCCPRAIVLDRGRMVAHGPLAELLAAPPDPTTAVMVAVARRG
ncbi:peptide/nickel transport system ATP-binding protein [Nannocystis exedens]|uniref:Peptide/nickel transport system ATP-binding protein n=1 Tax=Nannocystis exedens TaxID=54 RepID=A0A1I1WTB8_9BACT|nr:ATP-binding cassette domain-containing protein [Nannocystis exedens]PCC71014.1 Oligopeptide transport ATP-binding protein OppD [Nannocystis exedens]SFD98397.1 peptide/nickel transport system ATP-binding protein [Nannocystis exedens]